MTPVLTRLMLALGAEMAEWATTSERLETVIGDVLEGRSLTPREIEAVQALDGLSQHLRQLSQLCGDLSNPTLSGETETDNRIRSAVQRLNLSGLGQRLGGDPRHQPVVSGEAELW